MKLTSLAFVVPTLLVSACGLRDRGGLDTDSAESSLDSQESVESEGNIMMSSLDGADVQALAAATADQVAVTIAANIEARWAPNTCVDAVATGSNVHVTYTDCSGPRRLVHVTGELDLAVTVSIAGIGVHGTSDSLQVNGADLVVDATATYSRAGDERTVDVHSHGSGIGPRGNAIDHEGDYTVTSNPTTMCNTIDGHWQTDLSGARGAGERSNDVSLERCAQGCPTGTVTHHYLNGASLAITFDGTATAQWSTSLGGTGTIALQCQ